MNGRIQNTIWPKIRESGIFIHAVPAGNALSESFEFTHKKENEGKLKQNEYLKQLKI